VVLKWNPGSAVGHEGEEMELDDSVPGEIWRTPRSWVEKSHPNLVYFNEVDKGGHFAAWEEPELFASELRAAFRPVRH
jgi:hypothetical protein